MIDLSQFRYDGDKKLDIFTFKTNFTDDYRSKDEALPFFNENIKTMIEEQSKFFACANFSLLLIFQAMDAAGKDGAISHVMSGLNPQGTQVHSFKQPESEEQLHDYLWRVSNHLPEKGKIGIFNRSYYEEVLVVRVHNLIENEKIPPEYTKNIWERRFKQINNYEEYLLENGVISIKFFLHISKEEQKERLLSRINDKSKNWKFSQADIKERQYWKKYQESYEEAINNTATKAAPWYVVPSDKKWFSRLVISEVIVKTLKSLKLEYPVLDKEQLALLEKYKRLLEDGGEL